MATIRRNPVPSCSANTASSKSRASSPSMVTSGVLRRSSRLPSGTPRARAAAASASGETSCGMPCAWMQMRLTARASPMRPRRSTIRAGFKPWRAAGQRFGQHDLVGLGAGILAGRDAPLRLGPAIRRHQPARGAEHAQDAAGFLGQALERATFPLAVADGLQPGQHLFARGQCRLVTPLRSHQNQRRRAVPGPIHRPGHGIPVWIGACDADNHRVRQAAGRVRSGGVRLVRWRPPWLGPATKRATRGAVRDRHRILWKPHAFPTRPFAAWTKRRTASRLGRPGRGVSAT